MFDLVYAFYGNSYGKFISSSVGRFVDTNLMVFVSSGVLTVFHSWQYDTYLFFHHENVAWGLTYWVSLYDTLMSLKKRCLDKEECAR